jgi:hypothetical protein
VGNTHCAKISGKNKTKDEGIRRTSTNEAANGDMETMEETVDEKMEPAKAGYQLPKGV